MKIPSWMWYVAGVAIFFVIFVYVKGNVSVKQSKPIIAQTPDTFNIASYNSDVNSLLSILNTQAQEKLKTGIPTATPAPTAISGSMSTVTNPNATTVPLIGSN